METAVEWLKSMKRSVLLLPPDILIEERSFRMALLSAVCTEPERPKARLRVETPRAQPDCLYWADKVDPRLILWEVRDHYSLHWMGRLSKLRTTAVLLPVFEPRKDFHQRIAQFGTRSIEEISDSIGGLAESQRRYLRSRSDILFAYFSQPTILIHLWQYSAIPPLIDLAPLELYVTSHHLSYQVNECGSMAGDLARLLPTLAER